MPLQRVCTPTTPTLWKIPVSSRALQFETTPLPQIHSPGKLALELKTWRSVARLPGYLAKTRQRPQQQASGQPVMTLPGIGFGDEALYVTRRHLKRLGFDVHGWKLGVNIGSVPETIPKVAQRVAELVEQTGQPIALVGWSLGGYLAREVARENPELVSQVVTLASPIKGGPKYTVFSKLYELQGMDIDAMETIIASRDAVSIQTPITCIYSKNDGIVDWRAVADFHSPNVTRIEVDATHAAMGFDPLVLEHVGDALLGGLQAIESDRKSPKVPAQSS